MSKKKLIITTPAKSGLPSFYFKSFLDLISQGLPEYEAEIVIEDGNNALNLSRNIIVDDAVKGPFKDDDKMLMIDSDHKWDMDHLRQITSHDYLNYPIISGTYCKKVPGAPIWLGLATPGAKPLENGLLECDFLPTGFMCMEVSTIRRIAEDNPEREFFYDDHGKSRKMTELFPIGVMGPRTAEARLRRIKKILDGARESLDVCQTLEKINEACYDEQEPGRCVGEDYHFSYLAKKAGFTLWMDTRLITPHVGTCDFPIQQFMIATPAPIPVNASDTQTW